MASVTGGFLGVSPPHDDPATARYAVLPIPYDASTSYRAGARDGPRAILTASQHVEWLDEELRREFHTAGIATLEPVEPLVSGPEAQHYEIFKRARQLVRAGKFVLGLGGDHSVTSGLVRAALTRHRRLSVLQIDAHTDLRAAYQGSGYSHACVMRRCIELGATVVPVGIRAYSTEELRFVRRNGIEPITARQIHEDPGALDDALDRLSPHVYCTIDIDGFDPAYAPGTGTPEPGGLDWYQVTRLLRAAAQRSTIVGADVVEVLPIPGSSVTEFLAARLAYKLICYIEAARRSAAPGRARRRKR